METASERCRVYRDLQPSRVRAQQGGQLQVGIQHPKDTTQHATHSQDNWHNASRQALSGENLKS